MARLPRVTAPEMCRVLERIGFFLDHQTGAHRVYRDEAGQQVVVAYHRGKTLKPKTIKSILRMAGLTPEEFRRLL
jgi:predicted RNA binding protein YcfA (HicA-like mRNA interferase family)